MRKSAPPLHTQYLLANKIGIEEGGVGSSDFWARNGRHAVTSGIKNCRQGANGSYTPRM
jgi:hypothetical protein